MNTLNAVWLCLLCALMCTNATAQDDKGNQDNKGNTAKSKKKVVKPFTWINKPKEPPARVRHATFMSPSMGVEVGYCIYLPTQYDKSKQERFPVVYYLHGGRPGSETKSIKLAKYIHGHIKAKEVPPMIYVFVNGGPVSHYDMPGQEGAQGASVFIKELIPHVDSAYRTIASRAGRGIEGFSQGGRGTTRLVFRYPDLFSSAAPGGAGHATEKRISEEDGRESEKLVFAPGDNTYDLARSYAKTKSPDLSILIHVGTAGFNYQNNLAYMSFLDELEIPFQKVIVKDAPHSAQKIYDSASLQIMRFHARNFGLVD